MTQLAALVWLKWKLFRNALRSPKAVAGGVASTLGTLAGLLIALAVASALGVAAYFLASPETAREAVAPERVAQAGFLFLLGVFAIVYLMWAVVPLGLGAGNQFDPGRLLLYPIHLRKLFAIDFLSELTSLASIFAVPVVLAVVLGTGLARGSVVAALVMGVCAVAFGMSFAKLLATSVGALMRRRRTRGETLLAVIGAVAGLSGAFLGQLAPHLSRHQEALKGLWWTPPGAVASGLMNGLRAGGADDYAFALATLVAYTAAFVVATYWLARRAALGMGGAKRVRAAERRRDNVEGVAGGWRFPLMSDELSAVVEKELRYALRNAQLRLLVLMPLVLIGIRLMQRGGAGARGGEGLEAVPREASGIVEAFVRYGDGLLTAGGTLYVFMLLSALACNLFAFEEGGMRAFVLAPVGRRTILVGKNIAVVLIAFLYATLLLVINQIIFRDVSLQALGFTALCFVVFAATLSLVGNWLSIHFPKRQPFGKRMNLSGVAGLLVIPIMLGMAVPPLLAVVAGYLARSSAVKYATLAAFAFAAAALYGWLINVQGRSLARREVEILDAVSGRAEN
ncbi:MAG: hypothetical protein ACRD68_00455 [Pyrinomonadaceae bacterium]